MEHLRVFTNISELFSNGNTISNAVMVVQNGTITAVGERSSVEVPAGAITVDLGGRAVIPGLVDSHTHLVWAGSRVNEFAMKTEGAGYADILASGGGIHSTVQATQAASDDELLAGAEQRARTFLAGGVTTLEIKSGYGLTTEHELRMLRMVRYLSERTQQRLHPTLLAHLPDPSEPRERYLDRFITETIPTAAETGLATALDVFCDEGAFTISETRELLQAGAEHGLQLKLHAEQLAHTGASELIAEFGGLSADHLELSTKTDWEALAEAGTVATILPGAAALLHAPIPTMADLQASGVHVAIASDHNPGSSPLYGLLPALQLAIVNAGFSASAALTAGTAGTARALGQNTIGELRAGAHADFVVVAGPEAITPLYTWGVPSIHEVYIAGNAVYRA